MFQHILNAIDSAPTETVAAWLLSITYFVGVVHFYGELRPTSSLSKLGTVTAAAVWPVMLPYMLWLDWKDQR